MSKGLFTIATMMMVSSIGFAGYLTNPQLETESIDVVVPIVDSVADVRIQAGLMFYDIGSGLKIVNNLGQVENATYPDTVTSNGNGERVERLTLDGGGANTISSQSGSWISGVSYSGSVYTITIANGIFSAAPTCTCTFNETATSAYCTFNADPTVTTLSVLGIRGATGASIGTGPGKFQIVCMGPK